MNLFKCKHCCQAFVFCFDKDSISGKGASVTSTRWHGSAGLLASTPLSQCPWGRAVLGAPSGARWRNGPLFREISQGSKISNEQGVLLFEAVCPKNFCTKKLFCFCLSFKPPLGEKLPQSFRLNATQKFKTHYPPKHKPTLIVQESPDTTEA